MKPSLKTIPHKGKHVYLQPETSQPQKNADVVLWSAFKQGEPEAFKQLYSTYFPSLFNYGCQFTQEQEVVKDLIQDLFIDLNDKKERLGEVRNIKFYLFKSLKRRIMTLHKRKHLSHFPNFLQTHPQFAITVSHESTLIFNEACQQKTQALEKAYAQLTERQREVLLYYYHEGLNYEEITELMGFSKEEHTRKLVCRAVAKLREHMKGKGFWLLNFAIITAITAFYIIRNQIVTFF